MASLISRARRKRSASSGDALSGKFAQQAVEFFVEQLRDKFRRMLHGLAVCRLPPDQVAMQHALRDHQPVNAIGGQIFHVAIEQAGASCHSARRGGSGSPCAPPRACRSPCALQLPSAPAADRDSGSRFSDAPAIDSDKGTGPPRSAFWSGCPVHAPSIRQSASFFLSFSRTASARAFSSASSRLG